MANRTFSAEIYQLQVADYEQLSGPNLVKNPNRKPFIRATRPKLSKPDGTDFYSIGNRFKELSTGCKTETDAKKIDPVLKASLETVTTHEIYNYFDKELGVVREVKDPFTDLIERARRAVVNLKLIKPKLQYWTWVNDYLLDDNHPTKSAMSFIAYRSLRKDNPNYKPKITTTVKRTETTEVFKGVRVDQDGIEHDIWEDNGSANYWDQLLENYDDAVRLIYNNQNEMGIISEDRSSAVIPFFFNYMPDIYELDVETGREYIQKYGRDSAIVLAYFAHDGDANEMYDLFEILDPTVETGNHRPEAQLLRNLTEYYERLRKEENPQNPLPRELQAIKELEAQTKLEAVDEPKPVRPRIAPNISGSPTLLECLFGDEEKGIAAYYNDEKWERRRERTRVGVVNHIKACTKIIGDLPVDQITHNHGYDIAKYFHNRINKKGNRTANKTIETHINDMGTFSKFIIQRIKRPNAITSWMDYNPFSDLDISAYGEKKRGYEALAEDQLYSLFARQMTDSHRLLFEILIKCGVRLDEAVLLNWEQLKIGSRDGEEHIRYFDLSTSIIKNDAFSNRNVVLPESLELPAKGEGAIFPEWQQYLDGDGKGSKEASRQLMEKYIKPIRYNEQDDRKVIHSLRHNLIGLMNDLNDPPAVEHHMDWITGHGMEGDRPESERKSSYGSDPSLKNKYVIVNRIQHPWCKV